ncbi:MAG: DUF805 domain-containing protein [Holosporaceae bacterium]|jgi:uncharacterized membrane protein YhaH (DUF805 family)|nr:DUF805 domain-containing protein [Holosporaceae bacterium]
MEAFNDFFQNAFNFKGRSPRRNVWITQGILNLIFASLGFLNPPQERASVFVISFISLIFSYIVVAGFSLNARRLHDCGFSARKIYGYFSIVGLICLILFITIGDIKNEIAIGSTKGVIFSCLGFIVIIYSLVISVLIYFFKDNKDNKYGKYGEEHV